MDYLIVTSNDKIDLMLQVVGLLDVGWELQGGISVSLSESYDYQYIIFAQALIKRQK